MYLIHPRMPPLKVLAFDKVAHVLTGVRPDGSEVHDPNFHIDIVKRCGYSLTAEVPKEFRHGIAPRVQA